MAVNRVTTQQQKKSEEVKAYRMAIIGLTLQDVKFCASNKTILCDISTGQLRPIVSPTFHRKVFEAILDLLHPSICSTSDLGAKKFMWHGLEKQVGAWAKFCIDCQISKVHRHVKVSKRHFEHIHVDLVGPLPQMVNDTFLLMLIA